MALIDTLRDKWESTSPRERGLLVLLAAAIPIVLGLYAATQIGEGLDRREKANNKARKALLVLADVRTKGGPSPQDDVVKDMPTTPIALESYLDRAANTVGIKVPKFNPRQPVDAGAFTTHSMQIDLSDLTLTQLKDFLAAVETESRYVAVTSLTATRRTREDQKDKLDVKLEITAYSKIATKEKDKSGDDGKKNGSSAAGGN